MTINADGASSEIILQQNGTEIGRIGSGFAGTSGQVLTSNGAGAAPTMQDAAGGLYESVAIIADRKAYLTNGGTFASDTWVTRDLNYEITDPDGIVSISSNQFTLAAGTYTVKWRCPWYAVQHHSSSQLYDVSASTLLIDGQSDYVSAGASNGHHFGIANFTIASSNAYTIRHRHGGSTISSGLGHGTRYGSYSFFTYVEIYKHS